LILFNNANWFLAKALLKCLGFIALIPGSYIYVETPRLAPAPSCELTVFDLTDGGGVFLRMDRCDWLIDCGGEYDYARILLPYLRSRGVNRLDGLVFTHGDSRHIGGALSAVEDFHPYLLADSIFKDRSPTRRRLHDELNRRGNPKGLYQRGDLIPVGSRGTLRVLYPPAGLKRTLSDDLALVLQLEVEGCRVLFMSDSGFSTERWLIENHPDLRSDVLIKGHHSKDLSGTPDFLARVDPKVVVCGALNYGDPPTKLDAWVNQLTARGIAVFRQDRAGAVQVEIREDGIEARSYLGGQTFRIRAR
jgi:competence protein ComEC